MSIQKILELQAEINKLISELPLELSKPKLEMWKPANVPFYYIHDTGDTCWGSAESSNDFMECCHEIGNCFPTHELARYYAKKRAARHRLEMLALVENKLVPYVHDQIPAGVFSWHIQAFNQSVSIYQHGSTRGDTVYFPSRDAAQRVLDAMCDEDLIILFGAGRK